MPVDPANNEAVKDEPAILTKTHAPSESASTQNRSASSIIEAFIQGNYFYVISAVLFMAGCYMLMKAPFITGTIFEKTFKSFSVLAGYELCLLGAGALITKAIGRGGDVITLFLVAFVLLFDPTFFANAFHTIRLPEEVRITLAVCTAGLLLSVVKFEVFRRLLQLRVSWRFYTALIIALVTAWMNGLLFRFDASREHAGLIVFGLSWLPLLVIIITGAPRFSVAWVNPQGTPRFTTLVCLILPIISCIHIAELSYLQNVSLGMLLLVPLFFTGAYALLRAVKNPEDLLTAYIVVDAICGISILNAAVDLSSQLPQFLPFACSAAATGLLYAYGYWKHRSRIALYHLYTFGIGALLALVVLFIVKNGWPFPPIDGSRITHYLTPTTVLWLSTAIAVILAATKRTWYFWLMFALLFPIAAWMSGWLEPLGLRGVDITGLLLLIGFTFQVIRRGSLNSLQKLAVVMLTISALRYFSETLPVGLVVLTVQMTCVMAASIWRQKWSLLVIAALPLVIFAGPTLELLGKLHPSVYALGLGIIFFTAGIAVTFRKARQTRQPKSPKP